MMALGVNTWMFIVVSFYDWGYWHWFQRWIIVSRSLAFQLLCMVVSLEEFWWFDEFGWLWFVEGAVGWVGED